MPRSGWLSSQSRRSLRARQPDALPSSPVARRMTSSSGTFQEITHPDDLDLDSAGECLLAGEISSYQMEKRYLRPDESVVWVMLSSPSCATPRRADPLRLADRGHHRAQARPRRSYDAGRARSARPGCSTAAASTRSCSRSFAARPRARTVAPLCFCSTSTTSRMSTTPSDIAPATTSSARWRRRWTRRLRNTDHVARLGGDEFAAWCSTCTTSPKPARWRRSSRSAISHTRSSPAAAPPRSRSVSASLRSIRRRARARSTPSSRPTTRCIGQSAQAGTGFRLRHGLRLARRWVARSASTDCEVIEQRRLVSAVCRFVEPAAGR